MMMYTSHPTFPFLTLFPKNIKQCGQNYMPSKLFFSQYLVHSFNMALLLIGKCDGSDGRAVASNLAISSSIFDPLQKLYSRVVRAAAS